MVKIYLIGSVSRSLKRIRQLRQIVAAARKYWHGTSDPIELSEVLLEGEFIIREIIKTYPQPK